MDTYMNKELERKREHFRRRVLKILSIVFISLFGLYIGFKNYLLFHTIIEISTVIVAAIMLIIAFNTYDISKNSFLLFIGIGYGFVGGFDLLHALTYKGMGILEGNTSNLSIQFWITARYMEGLTIFLSLFHINRKLKPERIVIKFAIVFAILLASIVEFHIFPDCFIEGQGLTLFKIISEYLIIGVLFISMLILIKNREKISRVVVKTLIYSITITIFSGIAFTLYSDVYAVENIIGHILKIFSFIMIYKGIIRTGLREPYCLLFSELDRVNENLKDTADIIEKQKTVLNIKETEIKEIEEHLLKNEEVIKMLVDLSEYSILIHIKGEIIFVNKNVGKKLGLKKPEELIGRNILEYVHPDYHEIIKKRLEADLDKDDLIIPLETKLIADDGTEVYIKSLANSLIYRGNPARIVIIKDITENKKLLEVVEQDRVKTEAFANISHDLKTPINVFFASLQLLELYLKKGKLENDINKVHVHIKTMKLNSYRVIKLVNNLIDITKLGAGHMKLNLRKLNIISVIEDISMSVSEYMENKGIDYTFDTEIEEKDMAIDPDKIERIMLNLLSNAIKFTSIGGSIKVSIFDANDGVIISVKDTGTGIPEDKLIYIFERYKQVEETLIKNIQGTGIGLSLVKSMVELHGGSINVNSQWGVGTEFIIELPSINTYVEENSYFDYDNMGDNRVEKINIEFSDIYI